MLSGALFHLSKQRGYTLFAPSAGSPQPETLRAGITWQGQANGPDRLAPSRAS